MKTNRPEPELLNDLRANLSRPDLLVVSAEELAEYSHDATEYIEEPLALVMAETTDDIKSTIRFCSANNIPITARGAGTGLSGGCVPSPGGIVLSTQRLKELEIDRNRRLAVCGPGVITKELMDAAAGENLFYPPDPASYDESTMGGNVAEGAGGLRCKRFGVTRDYVIGLEAVLADCTTLQTGIFGSRRGFDLTDLLVASEGTLAVITRIAVRLVKPVGAGITILAAFGHPRDAGQTVSDITARGIITSVMEFIDGDAAACSNEYEKTDGLDDAAAILLIETGDKEAEKQAELIRNCCRANNCTLLRVESVPERVDLLWKVRRNLSKATKEIAGYRISEDVAVPNSCFPELVAFVGELNAASGVRINSYGHAGDGNLHVNFMAQSGSPAVLREVESAINRLVDKTLELGGTLSGEHGIGLAKRAYLDREFDRATLDAMRMIKSAFDPKRVLNPGKLLPDPL